MSETATTVDTPVAASAAEISPKRVYIGNLPFQATTEDIKSLFEDFKVLNVSVPRTKTAFKNGSFGYRKLGYAFAELESPEEAQRAVDSLAEKTLSDRPISVKLATATKKPRKSGVKKESSSEANEANATSDSKDEANGKSEESKESGNSSDSQPKSAKKPVAKKAAPQPKRKTGPVSVTTIFISNLPIETTEAEVKELTESFGPEEIRVVDKKSRRIYSVKEKKRVVRPPVTLAFVKFADEETQLKAIETLNGKSFKDVELIVKVAVDLAEEEPETSTEGSADAAELATTASQETSESAESKSIETAETTKAPETAEPVETDKAVTTTESLKSTETEPESTKATKE